MPFLQTVITGLLILVGFCVLAFSLRETNKILRLLPGGQFRDRWKILLRLMGFFLAGYLVVFIADLLNRTDILILLTGFIFFFGAFFVFLVTQVSLTTIKNLMATTVTKSYVDNIIQSMADALVVTDAGFSISLVNHKTLELTGFEEQELIGKKVSFLVTDLDTTTYPHQDEEHELSTRDGKNIPVVFSSSIIADHHGSRLGFVHTIRDITYRKQLEAELIHSASHDTLTGLPNRPYIIQHLVQILGDQAAAAAPTFAVIFIDLDNFKDVNDNLGHAAGDLILTMVSRKIEKCIRSEDLVGRLGGDEFVILIENFLSRDQASQVCERVLHELQEPMHVMGHDIILSASMGIALSGQEMRIAGDILKAADIAMYEAKKHGKARYEFYHPAMRYSGKGL